ncbi:haloacid dehalogenase [Danaus plexippus plexippus]|uniref:Haloacid dehalogenase n=1 Tax=Danaus plexippus plexippus TaxID=278856 RepID=A0A212EQH2_DANPL|nr:haloacid dehalogenase [Danaus plexippus plexippus]
MKYRVPPWDYYAIVAEKHGFKVDGKQVKQDFKKNYIELMKRHPNFGKQSIKWENCKPDKQLFKIAQEKINGVTCGSQCLHIGDDFIKDYEGAVKAGWNAVLITKETDFKEPYTCVKIFKNLLDLHNAIESHKLCFA